MSIAKPQVKTGIDRLIETSFRALDGMQIGLITNQTGLTSDLRTTIDILHSAKGVKLRALFSPEHGIRGEVDEKVGDSIDSATGLAVHSLYGETMKPRAEDLMGLNALVFDIQDIGCRFYTYISTLGNAMEAAASAKIKFFVLDRPNPINGVDVEGPIADADSLSFVAWHPLPVRHGMTVGELAQLFNAEKRLAVDLSIIQCENWRRNEFWDKTGLTWTNPSPNMRSVTEALLYPGIGLLETTNLSVGRGTDTPFEVVGAPWMDGAVVASHMNGLDLPGVRFVPIRFTPKTSVFHGEICRGVNIIITERDHYKSIRTGIELAIALQKLYHEVWQIDRFKRLLVNRSTFRLIQEGRSYKELEMAWGDGLHSFLRSRLKHLLY